MPPQIIVALWLTLTGLGQADLTEAKTPPASPLQIREIKLWLQKPAGRVPTVIFSYKLVNLSKQAVTLPREMAASRKLPAEYLVGSRQHWIECLDADGILGSMPRDALRKGRWYGGTAIVTTAAKPQFAAGKSLEFEDSLSIENFPAGKYKIHIEYQEHDTVQNLAALPFEIQTTADGLTVIHAGTAEYANATGSSDHVPSAKSDAIGVDAGGDASIDDSLVTPEQIRARLQQLKKVHDDERKKLAHDLKRANEGLVAAQFNLAAARQEVARASNPKDEDKKSSRRDQKEAEKNEDAAVATLRERELTFQQAQGRLTDANREYAAEVARLDERLKVLKKRDLKAVGSEKKSP